jgi:hypothetical protein
MIARSQDKGTAAEIIHFPGGLEFNTNFFVHDILKLYPRPSLDKEVLKDKFKG